MTKDEQEPIALADSVRRNVLATDLLGRNLEDLAIQRLRQYEPPAGYYLAFSGGKDSVVILDLAKRAGVAFDAHYHCTGVDPPELVRFIRMFRDVEFHNPERGMFGLIPERGFPIRQARWCCEVLKERGGVGRVVITGVRWQESPRRRRRRMFEACYRGSGRRFLHPIIDWSTSDVWQYIRGRALAYCPLYDEGWQRLGCVLCPFSSASQRERARWPRIDRAYRRAFHQLWRARKAAQPDWGAQWKDADEMYEWWRRRGARTAKDVDGQCMLFE